MYVLGEQFYKLKFGDRYFFTHTNVHPNLRFCDDDLEKLKQRKLRDILCENSDVPYLAQSVFRVPKEGNPVINCNKVNPLEAKDLCLFGSNRPAKDLETPGFKTTQRGTYM